MKVKRSALAGLLVCLATATASAQIAPNNQGDIGLFTMPVAASPRPGQLTLGLYGWKEQAEAGNLPFSNTDLRSRLYSQWAGEISLGLGLTTNWSAFVSAGEDRFESRGGWRGGTLNSIPFRGSFRADEPRKARIGTKYVLSSDDAAIKFGIWAAAHVPMGQASIHGDESVADLDRVKSRRTDWEWGVTGTQGIVTGMVSYTLMGRHDADVRVANRLRFGLGVDLPVMPMLHVITELDRTNYDGGDFPEENHSMLVTGARFYVGRTGWAVSGALNANVDLLVKHGFSPSPLGGILGVTYAAWPPLPPAAVVVPAPAPVPAAVVEEKVETTTPPAPQAPPPPAPKQTRDEIVFDAGSARLTNIAKAILDGIALRMKNDLNSTATVTGYSDNSGTEEANMAISAKRAEAAKEYLVTRHGIDPNRISTSAKGSAEPAYDNATAEGKAKNRRALIVVTLVSGA
jgi:outer membrane protein OmpA-like peptidoglycan-associated protein